MSAEQAWASYRAHIDRFEPFVAAFAALDPNPYTLEVQAPRGALAGLPFGVKDNIDVAGWASRAGSLTRAHRRPAEDHSAAVAALCAAGAVPVGKTVTTEFAFLDPAVTRNPHRLTHSPGGSSSGSAAAVAAGFVPLALGTQTAGSLCRPAAYCGIAAIKPTFGLIPTAGMVPLSHSFDTIGVMARRVVDAAIVLNTIAHLSRGKVREGRIGVLPPRFHRASSREINAFHGEAAAALERDGFRIDTIDPEFDPDLVIGDHRTVMLFEAACEHGHLLQDQPNAMGPLIRAALLEGMQIPVAAANAAHDRLDRTRDRLWESLREFDALLLQPVPETAPRGLSSTGDQSYQTPWTAFHGPLAVVPGRFGDDGLPMAAMIAAAPGNDALAIGIASELEKRLDRLPAYVSEPVSEASAK